MAIRRCLFVLALLTNAASVAAQENLVATGKVAFLRCVGCHNVIDAANSVKSGPHLHNLFGRKPGSLPGFEYSEAMVTFGQDKVWNETTLATFLHDPGGTVPGTKMNVLGLAKDEVVRAVIAYLATFDPDGLAPTQ